jgi:hypothetical protein
MNGSFDNVGWTDGHPLSKTSRLPKKQKQKCRLLKKKKSREVFQKKKFTFSKRQNSKERFVSLVKQYTVNVQILNNTRCIIISYELTRYFDG